MSRPWLPQTALSSPYFSAFSPLRFTQKWNVSLQWGVVCLLFVQILWSNWNTSQSSLIRFFFFALSGCIFQLDFKKLCLNLDSDKWNLWKLPWRSGILLFFYYFGLRIHMSFLSRIFFKTLVVCFHLFYLKWLHIRIFNCLHGQCFTDFFLVLVNIFFQMYS